MVSQGSKIFVSLKLSIDRQSGFLPNPVFIFVGMKQECIGRDIVVILGTVSHFLAFQRDKRSAFRIPKSEGKTCQPAF